MTVEAWSQLPDEVTGELVDGYLVEEELPSLVHDLIVTWLIHRLFGWVEPRGGLVVASGAKFAVGARTGRRPDLTLFLPERLPHDTALVRIPPSIAVEVVSQSARDRRRDRVEKHAEYAAFGIPWYWVVDPRPRTLEIFGRRERDGRFALAASATAERLCDVPGCPGLTLDLDELWRQVDRVAQPS